MHRKAIFFLAGIFLIVALVVPLEILVLQSDNDLDNYIISQNPNGLKQTATLQYLRRMKYRKIMEQHLFLLQ